MRQIGLQRVSPCNGYVIYSDCWNPFFHVNDNALVLYISTVEYAISSCCWRDVTKETAARFAIQILFSQT